METFLFYLKWRQQHNILCSFYLEIIVIIIIFPLSTIEIEPEDQLQRLGFVITIIILVV